jgi:hypothetical protein
MHTIVAALALILAVSSVGPALAQPPNAPTDCTEAMFGATTFVGHDCGEWATVLIAGTIIIRKPWSRANKASRAARIRERRESGEVTRTPPVRMPPEPEIPVGRECHPDYIDCLPIVDDLDCGDPEIEAHGGTVDLYDAANDEYRLDVNSGPGNAVGCDNES